MLRRDRGAHQSITGNVLVPPVDRMPSVIIELSPFYNGHILWGISLVKALLRIGSLKTLRSLSARWHLLPSSQGSFSS